MDLSVWACPVCLSTLSELGSVVVCSSENRSFGRLDGLPILIRPGQESILDDAQRYASAWKKTKWAGSKDAILEFPYVKKGPWKQKAQSLQELLEILGPPRERRVVDVGAGTGWLSYRLGQTGFRCFATDISSDSDVGLGVATRFDDTPNRFERAIATLDRWPFQSASVDVAICNASLHYLADFRAATTEAARVLRSGGVFIVMNSPVHQDSESALRASRHFKRQMQRLGASGALVDGHQHFVASELEDYLRHRFVSVQRHEARFGFWFNATRSLKGAVVRMELASFPIYEARVP